MVIKSIFVPSFSFQSPIWSSVIKGLIVITLGQVIIGTTNIIDQYFAAKLGAGQIAILGYTNRIISLMLTMGAIAINRATLPVFSSLKPDDINVNKLACRWAWWMFLLGTIVVVIVWLFSPSIIKLIYQRGAFSAEDTKIVVQLFRFGLMQVPFFMAGMVLVSLFSSKSKFSVLSSVAVIVLLIKYMFVSGFVDTYGLDAIILSTVVMQIFSVLLYWLLLMFKF